MYRGGLDSLRAIVAALMLLSEQIDVPHHLMPRYQDEDDESRLSTVNIVRTLTNSVQAFYLQIRTLLTLSATPTDLLPNRRCSTLSRPAGR